MVTYEAKDLVGLTYDLAYKCLGVPTLIEAEGGVTPIRNGSLIAKDEKGTLGHWRIKNERQALEVLAIADALTPEGVYAGSCGAATRPEKVTTYREPKQKFFSRHPKMRKALALLVGLSVPIVASSGCIEKQLEETQYNGGGDYEYSGKVISEKKEDGVYSIKLESVAKPNAPDMEAFFPNHNNTQVDGEIDVGDYAVLKGLWAGDGEPVQFDNQGNPYGENQGLVNNYTVIKKGTGNWNKTQGVANEVKSSLRKEAEDTMCVLGLVGGLASFWFGVMAYSLWHRGRREQDS